MFILDTNVLSEQTKPRPNVRVLEWLKNHAADRCYLSTVTIAEIARGVERAHRKVPEKGKALAQWLARVEAQFQGSIVPFDHSDAREWGRLMAERPEAPLDTMLAAQARARGLVVVTQNVRDFERRNVAFLDPSGEPAP